MDRKRIQCLSNASHAACTHLSSTISDITRYRWRVTGFWQFSWANERFFYHILLSPEYAHGTIAVNVTRLERGFNACQTPRRMYPSIYNRFWDIASYWSKIATFSDPTSAAPQRVTPLEDIDIHKTRMNGLSCSEESMTICSAVLIQYQRVTDRRTDRRTDGRPAYTYIYYVLQHSWRT